MTEENVSAEQNTQAADLSETVLQTAQQADTPSEDTDYEALYKEQLQRTEQAEKEARNLRKGYEKWKGIAKKVEREVEPEDYDQPSDISTVVQQEVQRILVEQNVDQ